MEKYFESPEWRATMQKMEERGRKIEEYVETGCVQSGLHELQECDFRGHAQSAQVAQETKATVYI